MEGTLEEEAALCAEGERVHVRQRDEAGDTLWISGEERFWPFLSSFGGVDDPEGAQS